MKTSEFIASMRATPGEVALTAEQVLARHQAMAGREEPVVSLEDAAEENALRMLQSGYRPGQISALAQQLGDVQGELETERAKLAAGRRRSDQVMRMHAAGQIGALAIPGMLDGDLGDESRVERLERRAESLRQQLGAVTEATSATAERARLENEDPLQRATRVARAAHREFVSASRAMMADVEYGRARRPFAVSRGAVVSAETCADCARVGASPGESAKIHEGLDRDAARRGGNARDAETDRLLALGYSAETARLAASPYAEVSR